MPEPPVLDYVEESHSERLARKSKEAPYFPIGIAGCLGAVAYGAYSFKNRGEMSPSVFLMKFRVIAQSMVVVTLGIGITFSMFNDYVLPKIQKMKDNSP